MDEPHFHHRTKIIFSSLTDPASILIIAIAFLIGGLVKGTAGLGLPVITVAVLTFAFGLPIAMALMLLPGLVSNAYQALAGPHLTPALKRIAVFLLPSLCTIWFGTGLLTTLDGKWLVVILGAILTAYALIGISGYSITIPREKERFIGPVFGAVNGVTTGMTGVTSTPSVIYLNGLGMAREMFIQSMGLLFFISYVVLTLSFWARDLVDFENATLSAFAVLPTMAGIWLGQKLRHRTTEASFKRLFYRVLLVIGLYLILRSLFS